MPYIERTRKARDYTREELDNLFDAVERAAINGCPLELHKLKDVLLPGNFTLVGFGTYAWCETLFEIRGLRWSYEGEVFSARISPQVRFSNVPVVCWYVSQTVCESGENAGAASEKTYMLRKNYRWYGTGVGGEETEV